MSTVEHGREMADITDNGLHAVCRSTELKDRLDVLDIGDVYGGMDYMHHMFEKFVTAPMYRSFVCEVGGKIAAFRFYRIIDEGNSVIGGGVRTHKDFRGQKLAKRLGEFSAQELLQEHPLIFRNYILTALDTPFYRQRISDSPKEYTLLSQRNILSLRITTSTIRAYLDSREQSLKIVHPTLDEFLQHLLNDSTKEKLFADRCITVGWEPFHLLRDNLADIHSERHAVWTPNSDGDPDWLSIRCAYPCTTGLRIDVDMYGSDPTCIPDHFADSMAYGIDQYPDFDGMCELLVYTPHQFPIPDEIISMNVLPGALNKHASYLVVHRDMMHN